eukprot:scaffold29.g5929.t1
MAKPRARPGARRAPAPEMPSDDEIDKHFAAKEDILRFEQESSGEEDLEGSELEALGLSGSDSELDSDEEEGKIGRIAKQAKALEAKLRIARGEGEEGEEEEDDDEGDDEGAGAGRGWGAGKRTYYGADTGDLEGSEAEDDAADEEEEARRLQAEAAVALRPEDFGLSASEEEGESISEEEGGGEERAGVAVEEVPKDLAALSEEAKRAAVEGSAQELSALIGELRAALAEVRGRLGPLLSEVRGGGLATAEGVSYLEAKHALLLHYCSSLVFYLLLKAEGRPVRDHPVIGRLVEIRAYLDKIRPIDKKLQYQLDKLLKAAEKAKADTAGGGADAAGAGGGEGKGDEGAAVAAGADGLDPLSYGPRPEALVPKVAGGAAGGGGDGGGAYRPPKLNPVSMELDEQRGPSARERREELRAQRRAARSTYELAAELAGAPMEERLAPAGMDTAAAIRERQRLAARDDVEEELMIRVPLSKEERKRLKAQRRAGLSGKALLDDFADDIADIVTAADAGVDGAFGRHRASQKFGADLVAPGGRKGRSGDADLPSREPLHERRAKYDAVRARQAAGGSDDKAPDELGGGGGRQRGGKRQREPGEEDEFYREAKAAAAGRKAARREAYSRPEPLPPVEDPTAADARKITRDIEKNRGLTPHRRKDLKNPRKKHRVKFAQATVRRRGQVQEARAGGGGRYGGEQTGVKARISKSVKIR